MKFILPALLALSGCSFLLGEPISEMERARLEYEKREAIASLCTKRRRDSFCELGPAYCREHIVEYDGVFYDCGPLP